MNYAGFLLAWVISYKEQWQQRSPTITEELQAALHTHLPDLQVSWQKGMTDVIDFSNATLSLSCQPCICNTSFAHRGPNGQDEQQ